MSDIQAALSRCDADDQTDAGMYLCGWRDLIVADRELMKIFDQRASQQPVRKAVLNARLVRWNKASDAYCQKMAHRQWAGGSIEPTVTIVCQAMNTQDLIKAIEKDQTAIPCKKRPLNICHD